MQTVETTYKISVWGLIRLKTKAYFKLLKFRLSFLVVLSALFAYMMAPGITGIDWMALLILGFGGFLVTGASNTLNQVLEMDFDRKMARTQNRPIPQGQVGQAEGVWFAIITGVIGIALLGTFFNLVAALMGIIALLSYAFVYTPMKRISRMSVFIGAFPGAMPVLIGWAAATGGLEAGAWILFMFQFIWQFPHFWAIAWLLDEDYKKAGFKMLPSQTGKSSFTASIILIYTTLLVPVCLLPWKMGMADVTGLVLLLIGGLGMTALSFSLLKKLDAKSAKRLMFGSFIYLPLIQIAFLLSKF